MDPRTRTTIKELKYGDRFYKPADKKKEVWEKTVSKTKVTKYQTYTQFAKETMINMHMHSKQIPKLFF